MAYTTIKKPSDYFNTVTYTGTGSSNSISSLNFSPDFCWFKSRNLAYHHYLFDSVRGANKAIYSALTNAETTQTDTLMSFDSNGFTLGTDTANGEMNSSGNSFVSWSWRGSDSSPASNTDGSITSTVSANTTSGFSIVSYTGTGANATVGHGLGVTPKMFIIKNRSDGTQFWSVYHASLSGADQYLVLDQTSSAQPGSAIFNSTHPTSSVFSVGGHGTTNANGNNHIAYCFADVQGFSKFGSYSGAGSNLPFIYTGFKPAFLIIKRTDVSDNWVMFDNKRNEFNLTDKRLYPNLGNAEATASSVSLDLLSNGFKLQGTDSQINNPSGTYIYMAFAEEPLVGDNPATAR